VDQGAELSWSEQFLIVPKPKDIIGLHPSGIGRSTGIDRPDADAGSLKHRKLLPDELVDLRYRKAGIGRGGLQQATHHDAPAPQKKPRGRPR